MSPLLQHVSADDDAFAPLSRVRALYDEVSSQDKRLRLLPGGHGDMDVQELQAQEDWLFAKMLHRVVADDADPDEDD